MIDLQTYRLRIGTFCAKQTNKPKVMKPKYQDDCNILGLALICTLLIIGGIEVNPGPVKADERSMPGPSFMNVSLMDVMQAIHHTQIQMDQLAQRIEQLTEMVKQIAPDQKVTHFDGVHGSEQVLPPHDADAACETRETNAEHQCMPVSRESKAKTNDKANKDDTTRTKTKVRKCGAILIGSQNVKRVKAAAMNEFMLDSNVSFMATESDSAMQSLSYAMLKTKAQKIDVVLHTGADQVTNRTADSVLESIASQISHAKLKRKTNQVFVCSVEQRLDAGLTANETAKTVNQELGNLCAEYGAKFLDLRPRMTECKFSGFNKTGCLYTFEAAGSIAQEILSEVPGFLD